MNLSVLPPPLNPKPPLLKAGEPRWFRAFPFMRTLREYQRGNLRPDFVAGLTTALFTIPQGMAYALIAGFPPAAGLATAVAASIIGAAFGSSEFLINGPTNAIVVMIAGNAALFAAQGNAIEVSPAPILEYDGNTITITADGIKVAQSFELEHDTPSWPLHEVWLHLARVGNPADDVVVEICADSSGQPGSVLASTSITGSTIPTTATWVECGFGGTINLAYGTTYWLQLRRSGSSATGNFFTVTLNDASLYARGDMLLVGAAGTYNARLQGTASMNFELWGHLPNVAQLAAILGDHELVEGVDYSQVSAAVSSRQYREGDQSARDEVETLLQWTSERWLLSIDADERAVIYPAPGEDAPVGVLGIDGSVRRRYGGAFEPGRSLAGEWVLLDDLPGYDTDAVGVGVQFVEACEYDASTMVMRLEFSDRRAWVIDGVVQG